MKNTGKTWKSQVTYFFNGYSILSNLLPLNFVNRDPRAGMPVAVIVCKDCVCGTLRHKDKTKQNCISEQLIHCSAAKIKMIPTNDLLAN